jgi:alginate O-acetyltransferase complex protein AlgI
VVFSSIPFLFYFLPLFMLAYFLTATIRGKNLITLLFSLVFYGWGGPWFVLVLLGSISFNVVAALMIDRCAGPRRTTALVVAVTVNLLMLATFKYSDFFVVNLNLLLDTGLQQPHFALPLGISFFTFHCLCYVIDVYRRRFAANRDPIEVALYIAFFPQLVAGPIVRYRTVARQLRSRRHRLAFASAGARIFIIGLAQKVLIADRLAPVVQTVFDQTLRPTMAEAWTGVLAYTVQIYYDFAGYSNMAVGIGLILGFTLPRNFRLPYASLSITEFWRRWHMSLSAWLRDYLYIPLGGSRGGKWQTYRNLITVFLLCGLWHGASWNFVLWGVWHGAFLVAERSFLGRQLARLPAPAQWAYALVVVMAGWVLFRARDLATARTIYGGMLGLHGTLALRFDVHVALNPGNVAPLIVGCALAVLPRWVRLPSLGQPVAAVGDTAWTFSLLILTMISVAAGAFSPFLYFRF